MDSSRVPIGSGQLTADPRRIRCHEPDIVQYIDFFSTLLGQKLWSKFNDILGKHFPNDDFAQSSRLTSNS